jgi:shikimate kinase
MRPIFLIGYMGSGKTTVGKRVANKLNLTFIDLDNLIETEVGKTISDIFNTQGEQGFRELEKDFLLKVSAQENTIVATGGGTPCFFDNIDLMNTAGTTIYLKMSVKALCNRLQNAKTERPLIKNKSAEELQNFIEKSLAERSVFYEKANHIINGENVSPDSILSLISA